MKGDAKARSAQIQAAAREILEASGFQPDDKVPYRELAPALMKRASCSLDTAKRHLVRAGRIIRGETSASQWGGSREGAGRRAKEEEVDA